MEFGKYGHCAIMAFELVKNEGIPAREAWQIAAEKIFEGRQAVLLKFVLKMLLEFNGAK